LQSFPDSLLLFLPPYSPDLNPIEIKPYKVCLNNLHLNVKPCLSNDLFNGDLTENIRMRGLNLEIAETGFDQFLDQNVMKVGLKNVQALFNGTNLKIPDTAGVELQTSQVSCKCKGESHNQYTRQPM
jgi:hypothetical protein